MSRTIGCLLVLASLFANTYAEEASKADQASNAEPKSRIQNFDLEAIISENGNRATTIPFELKDVNSDSTCQVFVRIINETPSPLTFNSVSSSCTCTSFKVPSETIEPGQETYAELHFLAVKLADLGQINAVINTTGDISKIYFSLKGKLKNVAKFKNSLATLEFDSEFVEKDSIVEYGIPLVVTSDLLPGDLDLKYDSEVPIVSYRFELEDQKPIVKVAVDTSLVDPNGITGELRLFRKNSEKSFSIPCFIRRGSRISLHPEGLAFADNKSATTFLRIKRDPRESKESKNREELVVNNITDKSKRFSIEYKSLSNGVYRLTVTPKPETKEVDASVRIGVLVDTSEGEFERSLSILSW